MYPIQDVADMLGLTLDQMAMMGSLVENDFMKHATHLKEFHYRIGVLRHPMDTVVCVGKYLKEGGSQHPDDIFMAETDQTVRSAYSAPVWPSVRSSALRQATPCSSADKICQTHGGEKGPHIHRSIRRAAGLSSR